MAKHNDNRLAPTLLVGLGGQGCKIVAMVSRLANEEQKKYLSFVAFDTDVNELRTIRRDYPDVRTVQTSSRLTVGEYLYNDENAKNNWFPINNILNRKTPSEGAGQVRAISRLVMDTAIRSGDLEPLHEAIDNLYKLTSEESTQATRIVIISSLAGGTGSGLILPVSMYIKNYLVTMNNRSASVIRGFFLLPEVMHSVIKSESERNNLYCNAYATLREIDAFMQKAFGTLDKRYDDLRFEVPKAGSPDEVDVYDEAPFDFCFLFSRDNIESEKMKSKDDLLAHAANCIYAQSIGPTNSRQNSSEDNTIRERVKSHGRNNYCGAGASTLVYPYQDVRDYIALNWARDAVSREWLVIDDEYREVMMDANEARSRGVVSAAPKRGRHYINSIRNKAKNEDGFAKAIIRETNVYDESGMIIEESKWERYLGALTRYVDDTVQQSFTDLDTAKEDLDARINELESGEENKDAPEEGFTDALKLLMRYRFMAEERTEEQGRSLAFDLFSSSRKPVRSVNLNAFHNLESNLMSGAGKMIHPNAVRYFLYNAEEELIKALNTEERSVSEQKEYWENFDSRLFQNDDKKRASTDAQSYINANIRPNSRTIKGLAHTMLRKHEDQDARNMLLESFRDMENSTQEFITSNTRMIIYREALEYVRKLSDAFEVFYNTFAGDVHKINHGIESIGKKYEIDSDQPVRYVCATKECLDALNRKSVNTTGTFELPGDLCASIFEKVRSYAVLKEKGEITVEKSRHMDEDAGSRYFQDMFEDTIMGFWKQTVSENCDAIIDMDIIEAIEKEAEILDDAFEPREKLHAVHSVIAAAKNLALPFIDAPKGFQPRIIDSCCFNEALLKTEYDDRTRLITEELIDFGGVTSDLTPKNEVVFFRSIYNLKAQDFKRFSPPVKSETIDQKAGNYFTAYYDCVNQVKPDSKETDIVTPHIHKNWHLISYLPDLNESYQKELESRICKAFVNGLLFRKIIYRPKNKSGKEYLYEMTFAESANSQYQNLCELTVSNGTQCDRLYEVFDAMIINPLAVQAILEDSAADIQRQEKNKIRVRESELIRSLNRFRLAEFSESVRSVFELPLLYKCSCPSKSYFHGWTDTMISCIFEILRNYVEHFENEEDVDDEYGKILFRQFELFMNNLPEIEGYGSGYEGIAVDALTSQIQSAVVLELRKIGNEAAHDLAEQMKDTYYHQAIASARKHSENFEGTFVREAGSEKGASVNQ